jgi:hypothetical protein
MPCPLLSSHSRIDETDEVGDRVVAKDHVHGGRIILVAVNRVELFCQVRGQAALAVAPQELAGAAPENSFVAGHPLNTQPVCENDGFFRDTALARPDTLGAYPEDLLVEV